MRGGDISHFGFLPPVRLSASFSWVLLALDAAYHHVFGYACNRLGTHFNLLVWIGALESCGTGE